MTTSLRRVVTTNFFRIPIRKFNLIKSLYDFFIVFENFIFFFLYSFNCLCFCFFGGIQKIIRKFFLNKNDNNNFIACSLVRAMNYFTVPYLINFGNIVRLVFNDEKFLLDILGSRDGDGDVFVTNSCFFIFFNGQFFSSRCLLEIVVVAGLIYNYLVSGYNVLYYLMFFYNYLCQI